MPNHWSKIIVHIVFSTKERVDLISHEIELELFKYISGIVAANGGRLIVSNGTSNHIHLLISIGRLDIGDLIGHIKRDSSVWVKKRFLKNNKFYWQRGYGAFSIGQSQVPTVSRYIRDQKEHHGSKGLSYEDEFRTLCLKYGVEIDERYCWE